MARRHQEWLRDVYDRQRNTVFPDTAASEARFWRNLFNGTRTLSGVQIAGVLVLVVWVLALVVGFSIEEKGGSFWETITIAFVRWSLAIGLLAGFLMVFGLARRLERRRTMKLTIYSPEP
jgi:uncharacterized BrkB/YihY/UPF0761 family membrane protein